MALVVNITKEQQQQVKLLATKQGKTIKDLVWNLLKTEIDKQQISLNENDDKAENKNEN